MFAPVWFNRDFCGFLAFVKFYHGEVGCSSKVLRHFSGHSSRQTILRTLENFFILEKQRRAHQRSQPPECDEFHEPIAGAPPAAKSRDDHACV